MKAILFIAIALYRFVQDSKPGQTTGQDLHDFGAGWYVVAPAGTKIRARGRR